jgi:hypothetical protein
VSSFRVHELKIPEIVMCRLSLKEVNSSLLRARRWSYLRNLIVRLRLSSMDDIREFHCVLNEEDWDVVSDDIPVALLCVELDSKTTNITDGVGRATATQHRGEANKDRSFARSVCQDAGGGNI